MIRIGAFSGEIPKVAPRYLPEANAQLAYNCRLDDGALTPIRQARLDATLTAPAASIYRHNGEWLSWPVPVNVVPGPVAQDRLYITGDGAPKVRVGNSTWDLAINPPATKPTVTTEGTIDPDNYETVVYAYTFLTSLDEESEPSVLSDPVEWSSGMTSVVSGFDPAPPDRVNRMRIYRSQTGQTGATSLNFIAERSYTTEPFVDPWGTNPIVEPISSVDYNAPPADLRGLIALPNGIMAGFVGKTIYFSEPYIPHAWPEKYTLSTDYEIVGLGAFGASMAVLTTGNPYVVSGTAPENMVMEKLELNLPCLSARGIVDLGTAVAYPSHDGLVTISSAGAALVTREVVGRQQWQQLNPAGLVAGQFSGRYMASYGYSIAGTEQRGIIIIDVNGGSAVSRASDSADDMFYEIQSGALYLLRNGTEVWQWDAPTQPNGELIWRSKPFVLSGHVNFGFILVEAENGISPEQAAAIQEKINAIRAQNRLKMDTGSIGGEVGGAMFSGITFAGDSLMETDDFGPGDGFDGAVAVTVFADGKEITTVYDVNEPVRLPGGFMARTWQIEVRGNMQVLGITIGHSPSELATT